jgi:hypothetical protein
MGTSSSTEWTAAASVFSGRPDPVWPLPPAAGVRLVALWDSLEPLEGDALVPPQLGYRGCCAAQADGIRRFAAYRGAVSLTALPVPGGGCEMRADPSRAFERLVLGSAPDAGLRQRILQLAGLCPSDGA